MLPVDNGALQRITAQADTAAAAAAAAAGGRGGSARSPGAGGAGSGVGAAGKGGQAQAFDAMNGVVARLLLSLTASIRFEGDLNTDLNEITMNLVPFRRLNFLLSSMAPCTGLGDGLIYNAHPKPRSIDHTFSEVFQPSSQLLCVDARRSTYRLRRVIRSLG